MKTKILLSILTLYFVTGCGEVLNSNTFDESLYGVTPDSGSSEFLAARDIMVSKCFACHGAWAGYSDADFVTNNLVVAGVPASSSLYTSLINNEFGGDQDMPASGPALSSGERLLIRTWIENM